MQVRVGNRPMWCAALSVVAWIWFANSVRAWEEGIQWPAEWNSAGACAEAEPARDKSPARVDLVGGTGQPAAFWQIQDGYVFFRERVAQRPNGPGGFAQFVWAVLVQTPGGDPLQYQWLISLNGKRDKVELWQNTSGRPVSFDPIFNDPAEVRVASLDAGKFARIVPAGTSLGGGEDYFVDWAFPIQCSGDSGRTRSGSRSNSANCLEAVGLNPSTASFWFVTSANANNFNKDYLNCPFVPGTELSITKSVAPSVIVAGSASGVQYTVKVTNTGSRNATGVTVRDTDLPAWINPTAVSTSLGSATLVPGGFEASMPILQPGAMMTIELQTTAAPPSAQTFVNSAEAQGINAAAVVGSAELQVVATSPTVSGTPTEPPPGATRTPTPTLPAGGTVSPTAIGSPVEIPSRTPTPTATSPATATWSPVPTNSPTATASPTWTATPTSSLTPTNTPTWTLPPTETPTATASPTRTSTPLPSATPTPTSLCGNGELDPGETCDDGNNANGDCCTADCRAEPEGTACEDGLSCTVGDTCDGFGICRSEPSTGQYAILRWSTAEPIGSFTAVLGLRSLVLGHVCTDIVRANGRSRVLGDMVALMPSGTAISFGLRTQVAGAVVTAGGFVARLDRAVVGEFKGADTAGQTPEMVQCSDARAQAAAVRTELIALPPGSNSLGPTVVKPRKTVRIPASGVLGPGTAVIDIADLKISSSGKLVIAASPETRDIVVRIPNRLRLGRRARIVLEGAQPNQVLYVVQGPATIGGTAYLPGTLIGADRIVLRRRALIEGALFGRTLLLSGSARIQRAPWSGWCR